MRAIALLCALVGPCAGSSGRAMDPPSGGVDLPDETGEDTGEPAPRLDLGDWPAPPDLGDVSSSGEPGSTGSTGSTGDASTGSTGGPGSTSDGSTGGSSTGGGSTGEAPAVCGDGACTGPEAAIPCWGPGWCAGDCAAAPACLTDCPCVPGGDNVCDNPPGACSATLPGGYCDPDGDGAYFDADFFRGAVEWAAKCG